MIRIIDCHSQDPFEALASRSIHRDEETARSVGATIEDVRRRGDEALLEHARRYDSPELASLGVSVQSMVEAGVRLPEAHRAALEEAKVRIAAFHLDQLARLTAQLERQTLADGSAAYSWSQSRARIGQRLCPLASVGVYVPGGNACYPSSVLMNALPAMVAGVGRVVVATPARRDGTLHPAVLVALREVGATQAFKVGGAAAVAALALGTESVPRVDKVVGPGNRFVNEAKRQLWGVVGLDGYAGPSEVCVLADETTNARYAAADLLTQIEHAPDNAGFLVCTSDTKLHEILDEAERQLLAAPRAETMRTALAHESLAFLARDLRQACEIVDAIAPEHLTVATRSPEQAMTYIHNAGCILLGEWTPESSGDFVTGPSHTLPTSGAARFGSPVNVLDFLKVQSVIQLTRDELRALTPTIEAFGEMEGFPTHARGASIRFDD